jgi:xanthine dehydrogenase molybdopterin-binding subunit B
MQSEVVQHERQRARRYRKRGLAALATKFGISFTFQPMNQAGATVSIFLDGSVAIAHGGIEMGQGLHTKMCQVAAQALDTPLDVRAAAARLLHATVYVGETLLRAAATPLVAPLLVNAPCPLNECCAGRESSHQPCCATWRFRPLSRRALQDMHIAETSTDKIPNASPTAASASSDLYGAAILDAARQLNERLAPIKEKLGAGASLREVANEAWMQRVDLCAHGFYATPGITGAYSLPPNACLAPSKFWNTPAAELDQKVAART